MGKRRALLIGIPEYESKKIDNLAIVRQDIDLLYAALKKSRFEVRPPDLDVAQTAQNKIKQAIRRECTKAKGVETLLIYFSGHGIHYQGKDYLVPSDVDLDDPQFLDEYLVSADLGDIVDLDRCEAKTILFFIDACREGFKLEFKAPYRNQWGRGDRRAASKRRCVLVFACEGGGYSQYVSGDEGFSLFAKALSEILDPQYPATTLGEVLQETQARLNHWANAKGKNRQTLHYSFESSVEDEILSRVICEGEITRSDREEISDPWTEAVLQSSLWRMGDEEDDSLLGQFKPQVICIVKACWQQWEAAKRAFPGDPWRDDRFSVRMLELLSDLLVYHASVDLTEVERALAIALPFVREAVLASAVVQAVKANPLTLEECKEKRGLREELERSHQGQPRFLRKAQRLQDRGRDREKDAVMAWLMHRCLLKTLEIWQPEAEGGYLADGFVAALQNFESCQSLLVQETLDRRRLIELARCTLVDAERIDRDDRPDALKDRISVGRYRNELEIREKMLAYLLKLAGLLAIDVRMLSDVLADHIGLADPLQPEAVVRTLNATRWNPSGLGRVLSVVCPHPAIDLALGNHVEEADGVLRQVLRLVAEKRGGMEGLADLPTHLLGDAIEADRHKGVPVYQTPHVNFQLAHDEVRELLMGEQLYGDPTLAIRELYQNALDACRYRQARLKYLQQTGQYRGGDWEGAIVFRQDKDGKGREYIECEDNGIGMEMLHLSQCFARAGRRFADLPEFIEEKSDWLKCDPPIRLYPNSQFGVGVLSYFMLADEIEVETCRLDRKEFFGQKLTVRIPSSSGLFRVQPLGESRDSGTRVRLYLNRTHYEGRPISCLETLKKLLWVAEFPTEVQQGARKETWNPGELKHPKIPQELCIKSSNNVWFVSQEESFSDKNGCILADGIYTEKSQSGIVINLYHDHYPKLSIDRKNILEWDKHYVYSIIVKSLENLVNWNFLSLDWLWRFARWYPKISTLIIELISKNNISLKLGNGENKNLNLNIDSVGCFFSDRHLLFLSLDIRYELACIPWWILPSRLYLWGKYGMLKLSKKCLDSFPKSMKIPDFPVLNPIDDIILKDLDSDASILNTYEDGQVPPAAIVLASAYLEESIAITFQRLEKFKRFGLELPTVDLEVLNNLAVTEEDLIALSQTIEDNRKTPWLNKWMPPAQIALASVRLNESVKETFKRLQKFAPLGLELPSVNTDNLDNLKITPEDIVILSQDFDGTNPPYWKKQISLAHIILAAQKLNESKKSTVERLERFLPLGLEIPEIDISHLDDLKITSEDVLILSRFLNRTRALNSNYISPVHIILATSKLSEDASQIIKRIQKFADIGIKIPQVNKTDLKRLTINPKDYRLFDWYLNYKNLDSSQEISPKNMIFSASQLQESITEIIERLKKFEVIGLIVPEINEDMKLLNQFIEDEKNLIPFSKNLSVEHPYPLLEGDIHPARIVVAACELNEPVPVTFERMKPFAHLFGVTLPEGEPDSW